jgi:hypothetical protein
MLFAFLSGQSLLAFSESGGKTFSGHRRESGMTIHLTEHPGPCRKDGPPVDVATWRRCRLLAAGFPDHLATALASTSNVDLHSLLQLVDLGCPPELAARILSPLPSGIAPS